MPFWAGASAVSKFRHMRTARKPEPSTIKTPLFATTRPENSRLATTRKRKEDISIEWRFSPFVCQYTTTSRNAFSKATVTFSPAKRKLTSWLFVRTVQLNTSNFWEHQLLSNVCQNITIFTSTMRNSTTIDYQLIEIIISIKSFLHHITLLSTQVFYLQEALHLSPGSSICTQVHFLSRFPPSFPFLRWGAC